MTVAGAPAAVHPGAVVHHSRQHVPGERERADDDTHRDGEPQDPVQEPRDVATPVRTQGEEERRHTDGQVRAGAVCPGPAQPPAATANSPATPAVYSSSAIRESGPIRAIRRRGRNSSPVM